MNGPARRELEEVIDVPRIRVYVEKSDNERVPGKGGECAALDVLVLGSLPAIAAVVVLNGDMKRVRDVIK